MKLWLELFIFAVSLYEIFGRIANDQYDDNASMLERKYEFRNFSRFILHAIYFPGSKICIAMVRNPEADGTAA